MFNKIYFRTDVNDITAITSGNQRILRNAFLIHKRHQRRVVNQPTPRKKMTIVLAKLKKIREFFQVYMRGPNKLPSRISYFYFRDIKLFCEFNQFFLVWKGVLFHIKDQILQGIVHIRLCQSIQLKQTVTEINEEGLITE